MAKVQNIGGSVRFPSFRGRVYIYGKGDKLVVAKWPKGKGRNISPAQKRSMDMMRQASWMCKTMAPSQVLQSYALSKHLQYLPRDILFMALYNRLFARITIDGVSMYSESTRQDISQWLDQLNASPGAVLFRGPAYWETLAPGLPGQVLTTQGPDVSPTWGAGGGGGGVKTAQLTVSSDLSSSSTWPRLIDFDSAPIQDETVWNIANPERCLIPVGTTYARFSAIIRLTSNTTTNGFYLSLEDQIGNNLVGLFGAASWARSVTSFNDLLFSFQGPWAPVAGIDWVSLRINRNGTGALAVLAGTGLTAEFR